MRSVIVSGGSPYRSKARGESFGLAVRFTATGAQKVIATEPAEILVWGELRHRPMTQYHDCRPIMAGQLSSGPDLPSGSDLTVTTGRVATFRQ